MSLYFRKKNIIAGYLAFEFLFIGLTILHQFLDKFSKYIIPTPLFPEGSYFYILLTTRSTFFFLLANLMFFRIFLILFETDLKITKIKTITVIYYIFTGIGIALHLIPGDIPYMIDITSLYVLLHSLVIYIPLSRISYRIYDKIESNKVEKTGFFFFFLMTVGFQLLWTFVIADIIYGLVTNLKFGIFFYLYWLAGFFTLIVGYIGLTFPKWFRNLIQKRIEKSHSSK